MRNICIHKGLLLIKSLPATPGGEAFCKSLHALLVSFPVLTISYRPREFIQPMTKLATSMFLVPTIIMCSIPGIGPGEPG